MLSHYQILRISRKATPDEVKKAYYSQAKQFHPDKNKASDAEESFKRIGKAYEILSDPAKRKNYDDQLFSEDPAAQECKYSCYMFFLNQYLKTISYEEALQFLKDIQEDILECFYYHLHRNANYEHIALSSLLFHTPKEFFPFMISLVKKDNKLDICIKDSSNLYSLLNRMSHENRVCLLNLLGSERLENIIKIGKKRDLLAKYCPKPEDFPHNSPMEKVLEAAHNPSFYLRVLSVLDVCPLLAFLLIPVGIAYFSARILNDGNRLTNQKFSFFAWHDSNYSEFGLCSEFNRNICCM